MALPSANASAGHRLGQFIGDWFEQYIAHCVLLRVAEQLDLFLDSRFVDRECRPGKLLWEDENGNSVDYDFVLELGGSAAERGIPVAFFECFWRRGSRHSKDKARDDSGKLLPMRDAYPTTRFLGIVAAGDFTKPARDFVRSRSIDLFYIPKDKIVEAFQIHGLVMDYPDSLNEAGKAEIAANFNQRFNEHAKRQIAETLFQLVGETSVSSYVSRVSSALSALPQEIRFALRHDSESVSFETVTEASRFLETPDFPTANPVESFLYRVMFSDGTEFVMCAETLDRLRATHAGLEKLVHHMEQLNNR